MEEERRIEEEQRKAEEQQSTKNSKSTNENDGFSRIYGEFGLKLSNKEDKDASVSVDDTLHHGVNGKVVRLPAAKRSLAQSSDFDSSHQTSKADSSFRNHTSDQKSFELPLSDVTRSQSPSKPTTKPSPGRLAKPAATVKEKPAAKDDPIMALMMQVEARKNKSKETTAGALPVHVASPAKRAKVDPMDILRRRSKESPTVPNVRHDPMEMIAQSPVHLASPTKRIKADPMDILRRRSKESPAGTNARHDPMEIARKKEKERAMRKEEPQSGNVKEVEASPKAEAKNPLALARNEEQRSFSPQAHNRGSGPVALPDASDGNDDSTIVTDNRKKPAAQMTSSQARTEPLPKKKGGLKVAPRSGRSRNDDDSDDYSSDAESDGGHVDGEQDDTLIPTFDDPKMGPPSALEPLELPRGTDQTIGHTIPASINRYLRGYQQQGVIFMYSCIMQKSGGILGDDMGLVSERRFRQYCGSDLSVH